MLVVLVKFKIKSPYRNVFRSELLVNAATSLASEAGCNVFEVCETDSGEFLLYEQYADRIAFDVHLQSAHFAGFSARTADWVEDKQISIATRLNSAL